MITWTVTDITGIDETWTATSRDELRAGLAEQFDTDREDIAAAIDRLATLAGIGYTGDDEAYLGIQLA